VNWTLSVDPVTNAIRIDPPGAGGVSGPRRRLAVPSRWCQLRGARVVYLRPPGDRFRRAGCPSSSPRHV